MGLAPGPRGGTGFPSQQRMGELMGGPWGVPAGAESTPGLVLVTPGSQTRRDPGLKWRQGHSGHRQGCPPVQGDAQSPTSCQPMEVAGTPARCRWEAHAGDLVGVRPAEAGRRQGNGEGERCLARAEPSLHMQRSVNTSLTATSTCTASSLTNGFSKLHLTAHPS